MDYKGFGPKELANRTEIDIKAIQSYIKKNSPSIPNAETAVRIAKTLEITVEILVDGEKNGYSHITGSQFEKRKIMDTISKLNPYNVEVITSIALALLNLQLKKNHRDK